MIRRFHLAIAMALCIATCTSISGLAVVSPAAAASKSITIGFVCSCTGSPEASSTAIAKPSFEAWARATNAHGGIDGKKVEVDYVDDQFNPGTSLAEVERLVSQDHVAAIVDSSYEDTAWSTYVRQHKVPVIGDITDDLFTTNPDFFAVGETLDDYFTTFVLAAKKVGVHDISEFYCAEAVTCQEGIAPLEKTAKHLGVAVPYVAEISASAPNYTSQCLAAKQAGVKAIIIADAISVVTHVMSDCTSQGYDPWAIALAGAVSTTYTSAPGLANRFIGAEPDVPFFVKNTPATRAYYAALRKYEPSVLTNANFGETVTQSWIDGLLISAAARAGGVGKGNGHPPAQMLHGLYSLHRDTLGGMAPPLTYKKGKPNPIDCWYWVRIQHGKFTSPDPTTATCARPTPLN